MQFNHDFIDEFLNKWDLKYRRAKKDIGGAISGLFGGGGGGSQPAVQTTQQPIIRPGQESIIDALTSFLRPQIGQVPRVPGTEFAPVGPGALQQQAFGLAQQLPQQLGFDPQQITQQFQPTAEFARQGFQQETIPAIAGAVGFGGGARSSGFQDILAREGRRLELGLAGQLGQQQFGAAQAALGRQANIPSQLFNIGVGQQGFPAQQRAFELQQFQAADPLRNPALQLGQQVAGLPSFQNLNVVQPGTPGLGQQLLPLAGQVIGAAGQAGGFGNLFAGLGGLFN